MKLRPTVTLNKVYPYLEEDIKSIYLKQNLQKLMSDIPHKCKKNIWHYLRGGNEICFIFGIAYDPISHEKINIPPHDMTDGIWFWEASLIYYVERYISPCQKNFSITWKKTNGCAQISMSTILSSHIRYHTMSCHTKKLNH